MKNNYFILISLLSIQFYAQKVELVVLDNTSEKFIENAHFYAGNKIVGKSNQSGNVIFKNIDFDSLTVVKEDYRDTIISLKDFAKNKLYLRKIDGIALNEIVVYKRDVKNILDSVKTNILKSNIYSINHHHFYNILYSEKDTLLYINNRINYFKGKGAFIERGNTIMSNFTTNHNYSPVFILDQNKISFNKNFNHNNSPVNSFELMHIITSFDDFVYQISEDLEGKYYIDFTFTKKNKEYPYTGYIIVDRKDFGIYEFKAKLSDKNTLRSNIIDDKVIKFRILNEESFIKYNKNANNEYFFVKYDYDSELTVLNGSLKGKIFTNKCRKEITPVFDTTLSVQFNISTYKFLL